jgi:hypothetical protein
LRRLVERCMTEVPELQTISLETALRYLATEAELAELDKYSEYRDLVLNVIASMAYQSTPEKGLAIKYFRLRAPLEARLLQKLFSGEIVAIGLQLPVTLNSQRTPIPAHFWRILELDIDTSEACGEDLKIVGIEIVLSSNLLSIAQSVDDRNHQTPVGTNNSIYFSEDNREFTVGSEVMYFQGSKQRSILRQLFDVYKEGKGRRLRTLDVLHKAGSSATSIRQAFSGSLYWSKLEPLIKREGGECWLEF